MHASMPLHAWGLQHCSPATQACRHATRAMAPFASEKPPAPSPALAPPSTYLQGKTSQPRSVSTTPENNASSHFTITILMNSKQAADYNQTPRAIACAACSSSQAARVITSQAPDQSHNNAAGRKRHRQCPEQSAKRKTDSMTHSMSQTHRRRPEDLTSNRLSPGGWPGAYELLMVQAARSSDSTN